MGYLYCIGNPGTDWLYNTEPSAKLNGRSLRYPRGKTLGGSSSINGMIYMRGQSRDYDHWAKLIGDPTWTWDSVLPAVCKREDHFLFYFNDLSATDAASVKACNQLLCNSALQSNASGSTRTNLWFTLVVNSNVACE